MCWLIFFALAALAWPGIARISPYDPDDALRPDNVTGLVYEYYNEIGSYYNGTLTIRVQPAYNPPASWETDKYLCDEYENRTFDVNMNAMAGFKKPPPASAPHINPFFLDIEVWPMPYELELPWKANYTDGAAFSIASELGGHEGPRYKLNMTTAMSTNTSGSSAGSTTSSGYHFDGEATTDFPLWSQTFAFNVSGVCSGWRSTNTVLYSGDLIRPIDINSGTTYDWITNVTAPDTAISGSFDQETAQVRLSSAFSAARARDRKIVGRVELIFSGKIDSERSDQLVLGRETPDWNATLGFARGSVAGVEDGGSRGLGNLRVLSLTGFVGILLAI